MIRRLTATRQGLERYWVHILIVGQILVVFGNWRLWRSNRALLGQRESHDLDRPFNSWPAHPRISVLVAAWNESKHIDEHITSFLRLQYPSIELILCAGGTDDTLERASRYQSERVIVLEQAQGEGKQRALARCYARATGDILYLTDADCCYRSDALERAVAPLVIDGEHASTGASRPLDTQLQQILPFHLWVSEVATAARLPTYVNGLLGRNAAVSRHAIERAGGLDFVARTGTDYHLAQKLLAKDIAIRAVPSSVVPSSYPDSVSEYRKKQSRWLRNLLLYSPQYKAEADLTATRRTIATGSIMTVMPLLTVLLGRFVLVTWLLLLSHAVASRVRYMLYASRATGRPVPRAYPGLLTFLTILDFVVWALPALDMVHPERRERW